MGLITPNPKLKLLDQVREVMRIKNYSLSTERTYCDWIRRYIRFHGMQVREELSNSKDCRMDRASYRERTRMDANKSRFANSNGARLC